MNSEEDDEEPKLNGELLLPLPPNGNTEADFEASVVVTGSPTASLLPSRGPPVSEGAPEASVVAGVPGLPPPPPPPPPPDGSPPVLKVKPTPTPSRDDPDGPVTGVVAGVGFLMAPPPVLPPDSGGAMVTGLMLAPVLPSGFSGCCEGVMDGVVATLVLMAGAAVLCGREATDGAEVTPDGAGVTPDGAEVTPIVVQAETVAPVQ